jgi:hypothetical protein
MAGVFVRRALVALAAACACAVAVPPAFAAPPPNDTPAGAYDLVPANNIGNRNVPRYSDATGASFAAQNIDVTEATSAPDDPLLQTPNVEDSDCNNLPTSGYRTVFYKIRLQERHALTIDTAGSQAPTILGLYEEGVSAATLVSCARGNLVDSQTALTYVTRPGTTYFLEVAGTTPAAGPTKVNLFMRATDVQPPVLTITANQGDAQPGKRALFGLSATPDAGSGDDPAAMPVWTITFTPDGTSAPVELEATPVVDTNGYEVRVQWPGGRAGWGQARVTLTDRAGNVGSNTLKVRVRDRTPPTFSGRTERQRSGYRADHRRNIVWAWARCTERGWVQFQLLGPRRGRVTPKVPRAGVRKVVRWTKLPPGGYLLTYRCRDAAGNWSATRASRPFLLR